MTSKASRGGVIDLYPTNSGGAPVLAIAELYDDKDFKDTKLIAYETTTLSTAVPKLSSHGFNDKASSIKVFNNIDPKIYYTVTFYEEGSTKKVQKTFRGSSMRPVLTCFHNSDYSGAALYCIAPPTGSTAVHTDNNLKTIGWNDRISSLGWLLVTDFSFFNGENPKIPAHPDC